MDNVVAFCGDPASDEIEALLIGGCMPAGKAQGVRSSGSVAAIELFATSLHILRVTGCA
jgi:hypothetical protein